MESADRRQGLDPETLIRHFGTVDDLIPLWIAEPDVALAPSVVDALTTRAADGWYGYETRPASVIDAFHDWAATRHGWRSADLATLVSPSVGTTIGALIDLLSAPDEAVILQPPVFTDFKSLANAAGRPVLRNPLVEIDGRHDLDLDGLETVAADPHARILVLCNPHNPVGRVWTTEQLRRIAEICAAHDVVVVADEIHADLALAPNRFVPFAEAARGTRVRWAAAHGPIKTFGLAGVCDTLVVTDDEQIAERFGARSSQLHLTRNNVFGLTAFETAYRTGGPWLDDLLDLVADNVTALRDGLPPEIALVEPEGTYLGWLDVRALDLPVAEVAGWLATRAGVAVSPGHWFGREGAGFARVTLAVPPETMRRAVEQIDAAVRTR